MNKNLYVINSEPVIRAFQDLANGKVNAAMLQSKDFGIAQSETEPLEGYEKPKDFPFCCESHKKLFQIGADSLAAFPDCCEAHKRLKATKWFNKDNFSYLPLKLVTTVSYTMHCVLKCIDNPNWYNEITQYIDYTKQSYGQLPEGFGSPVGVALYLRNIEKNIKDVAGVPDEKKAKLLAYLRDYDKVEEPGEQAELNILIDYYKRWVKDFPFEISFFSHLKDHFEKQIPILKEKVGENMYTGMVGYKLYTHKELVEFLVSTTKEILCEINTQTLYEEGAITDIQKAGIELLNANRRLELKTLGAKMPKDRKQYIKVLKQWLKGENDYLRELKAILQTVKPSNQTDKGQMTQGDYLDIILYGYVQNPDYLDKHIYRECKEAEKRYIDFVEFFDRLIKAYELLIKERDKHYYERLNEVYLMISMREAKGQSTEDLEDQKPKKEDFWINLFHISNGRFTGHLTAESLNHISNAISEAWKMAKTEKMPESNKSDIQEGIKDKKRLYNSFALLSFFLIPDKPEQGVVWLDSEGRWTYDFEKLVKKETIEIPQQRQANNEDDFLFILNRELKKNALQNNPEDKIFLTALLIPEIDRLIQLHKENREYGISMDAPLLQVAQRFKDWLNNHCQSKQDLSDSNVKEPESLKEIFVNADHYTNAIRALQELKIIDKDKNNLIGSLLKGVMQVWIDVLKNERGQLKNVKDATLTKLVNNEFPGLNLSTKTDGKHFRNPINKTANKKYRAKLIAMIR